MSLENEIVSIKPLAVLKGDTTGARFIAEIDKQDGKTILASVLPPLYKLSEAIEIPFEIYESSVTKHGYVQKDENPITTAEDYERYLSKINHGTDNSDHEV